MLRSSITIIHKKGPCFINFQTKKYIMTSVFWSSLLTSLTLNDIFLLGTPQTFLFRLMNSSTIFIDLLSPNNDTAGELSLPFWNLKWNTFFSSKNATTNIYKAKDILASVCMFLTDYNCRVSWTPDTSALRMFLAIFVKMSLQVKVTTTSTSMPFIGHGLTRKVTLNLERKVKMLQACEE